MLQAFVSSSITNINNVAWQQQALVVANPHFCMEQMIGTRDLVGPTSRKYFLASLIWYGFDSRPNLPKEAQKTPCQSDLTA